MAAFNEETMRFGRKQDLFTTKKMEALVEISLGMIRLQLEKVEKTIKAKKHLVIVLEEMLQRVKLIAEEFRKENEQKSLEVIAISKGARTELFRLKTEAEKLRGKILDVNSQIQMKEDMVNEYKGYKDLLIDLMSLEQEIEQESQTVTLSSAQNDTLVTNSDSSDYQKAEEYYSDSWKLLNVMTGLKKYNLSLIENKSREEETLIYQREDTDIMSQKFKLAKDKEMMRVNEVKNRAKNVREVTVDLKKKIEMHEHIKNTEEDILLQSLEKMVCELYQTHVNSRPTAINSLKKLSAVEHHLMSLLREIDAIDGERLEKLRKEQWNIKKYLWQQENVKREWEKKQERLRKCMERAFGERKVITGRKLMPKSMITKQEVTVSTKEVKYVTPEDIIWEELIAEKYGKAMPKVSWKEWLCALEKSRKEKMRGTVLPPSHKETTEQDRPFTAFAGKAQPPSSLPLNSRLPQIQLALKKRYKKNVHDLPDPTTVLTF
ncbi:Coiled-coil domain-containing protein 38 [Channa argus]|uniref:Coiled-coil domain-containing protein 38 n=1 Tax=Channa argus TaxID=215402 RepID=A0A6G1QAR3_CHAAH|nr:Coiled-coil domain-containing protein 38 [Channa argus]KAK2893252.1 hypothetical protein Q8A73_015736 [Channa argus]